MTDLVLIKDLVISLIKNYGDQILQARGSMNLIIHEDEVDVTSDIEKDIEQDFSSFVSKNFPTFGFQGEELPELLREGKEYTFIIDPIDGSKFYAKQVPFWTITIALLYKGEPVLGVVYAPVLEQLFYAIKGGGAYLNDKKISLSSETEIKKLQISLDLSIKSKIYKKNKHLLTPIIEALHSSCYRVRMLGCGSLSLTWLAQGFFGGYFYIFPQQNEKKEFLDIAAGIVIAQEAGAVMYKKEIHGEEAFLVRIVGKREVVEELIEISS